MQTAVLGSIISNDNKGWCPRTSHGQQSLGSISNDFFYVLVIKMLYKGNLIKWACSRNLKERGVKPIVDYDWLSNATL